MAAPPSGGSSDTDRRVRCLIRGRHADQSLGDRTSRVWQATEPLMATPRGIRLSADPDTGTAPDNNRRATVAESPGCLLARGMAGASSCSAALSVCATPRPRLEAAEKILTDSGAHRRTQAHWACPPSTDTATLGPADALHGDVVVLGRGVVGPAGLLRRQGGRRTVPGVLLCLDSTCAAPGSPVQPTGRRRRGHRSKLLAPACKLSRWSQRPSRGLIAFGA
jgi:hypothetical protein